MHAVRRLLVPAVCPLNTVHSPKFSAFKNHFTNNLQSTRGSSKWALSGRFSHQQPVCISPLSTVFHAPRQTYLLFGQPNDIWWGMRTMKLLFTRLSRACTCAPLIEHLRLYFPWAWEMGLHTSIQQQPNYKCVYITPNIPVVCVCVCVCEVCSESFCVE